MKTPTTLDQLLASLSSPMAKAASEGEGSDDKGSDSDKTPAFLKKDDDKEDGKKGEAKKDDKSEGDDSEGQTKEAAAAGSALAREIMQKTAAAMNTPIEGNTPMNKQASQAGQTLAQALLAQLTKSAGEAETNTPDGLFPESVPTRLQRDTAEMVHEQASQTKPMPTSDGLRPTGTINQLFDAIVADAVGQGAASTDQVHTTGVSQVEGAVEDHATPNQAEEVEKTAALNALIEQGFSFDDATSMVKAAAWELEQEADELEKAAAVNTLVSEYGVNYDDAISMVKAAEAQIQFEEIELEKTAYLNALMSEGVDFDSAVAMIKSASELETNQHDGIFQESVPTRLQRDVAEQVAEHDSIIRPMQTSDGLRPTGSINEIFDAVIADALGQGAASVDQVHSTGVSQVEGAVEDHAVPNQVGEVEKVAALNGFLAAGVDFDSAVAMVKEAEATIADLARGWASPTWMRAEVARRNGAEPREIGFGEHTSNGLRVAGRAYAEGLPAGALGAGAAYGIQRALGKTHPSMKAVIGTGLAGLGAGMLHGGNASLRNQVAEEEALHQKAASIGGAFTRAKRLVQVAPRRAGEAYQKGVSAIRDAHLTRQMGGNAELMANRISDATAPARQFVVDKTAPLRSKINQAAGVVSQKAGQGAAWVGEHGRMAGEDLRMLGTSNQRGRAAMSLIKNPLVQGIGAAGAIGGGGYALANAGGDGGQVKTASFNLDLEKRAAVDLLMDNGVDFDSAVALVAAKSQELYGE